MFKYIFLFLLTLSLSADVIRIGTKEDIFSLNPLFSKTILTEQLYAPLFDKNNNPILAKSYSLSNDALTYNIKIKNNIMFNEDIQLTSEDVKFTYNIAKDKKIQSLYYTSLENIKKINIISEYDIQFELYKKDLDFINKLQVPILPKEVLIQNGLVFFNKNAIGLGAYKIKKIRKNDYIELKNNIYSPIDSFNSSIKLFKYKNNSELLFAINSNMIDVALFDNNFYKLNSLKHNLNKLITPNNNIISLIFTQNNTLYKSIKKSICLDNISTQLNKAFVIFYDNNCDKIKAKAELNNMQYFIPKTMIEFNINSNEKNPPVFFMKNNKELDFNILIFEKTNLIQDLANIIKNNLIKFGIKANIIYSDFIKNERIDAILIDYPMYLSKNNTFYQILNQSLNTTSINPTNTFILNIAKKTNLLVYTNKIKALNNYDINKLHLLEEK